MTKLEVVLELEENDTTTFLEETLIEQSCPHFFGLSENYNCPFRNGIRVDLAVCRACWEEEE